MPLSQVREAVADLDSPQLWRELDIIEGRRPLAVPVAGPAAPGLPSPPTDVELYAYLGTQSRWPLLMHLSVTVFTVHAMWQFAMAHAAFRPWLTVVLVSVVAAFVGVATSYLRPRLSKEQHAGVLRWDPAYGGTSIDVLLPSAGEPLEILENTFRHVAGMYWPGPITVFVLDDAASPDVELLAAEYGFQYSTRPDRGHLKKAGNLKHGYALGTGDLLVVFDADFVPRPDFLAHVLPYFADESVGIVQTPQYFDTSKHQNWLERGAGATQEFFYRWVQPSRDRWDAAICVGTNAVYRRRALQAAGGFAQIGHSEDVHTGVKLAKAGYRTRYLPVVVAKGLCPDALPAFINQQYRWCTGSLSLLADRTFHAAGLGWRRYLCFWSGFLYYLSSGFLVFALPVPAVLMMWFFSDSIHVLHYLWMLPVFVVSLVLWPATRRSRGRFSVIRVQLVTQYSFAVAIWDSLRRKPAAWVATGAVSKGSPLASRVTRLMRGHLGVMQALYWVGLATHAATIGVAACAALVALGLLTQITTAPLLLGRAPRASAH